MNSPDETRTFENGTTIGRMTLEPGWSWDKCVKPIVKTNSYEAPHTQYMISGRIKVVMDDGSEEEFRPGDTDIVPPGHNAWVVGNEPVVGIDFTGLRDYAKEGGPQAQQAQQKGRRKRLEAINEEKSYDLFTSYMNSWYDYVNECNSMYAEYIRNITKTTEFWFDSFSKFWSVQYKDKVKQSSLDLFLDCIDYNFLS